MMNCPGCNKFAALNFEDPEVQGLEVEGLGEGRFNVTAEVRIYRTSECCGEEMKEATLNMEAEIDLNENEAYCKLRKKQGGDDLEVEVEEVACNQIEEGGGRYQKSYFGAEIEFELKCGNTVLEQGSMSDKVPASGMDELV
jgi:hypothetical protein